MRSVPVWDFPSRLFHWILAVAVITSYLTGEEDGVWFVVHTVSGYTVALLLVFRFAWGFVGSVHSRFSDFVYSPWSVTAYAKQLLQFNPPRFVGHNPLGGWMVIVMLAVLVGTVATGLFSGNDDGSAGILLPLIATPGGEGLAEVHEFFGTFMLVLATIHVLAVVADWCLTKENLVKAMITGRKMLDDTQAGKQRPLVGGWRGVVAATIVAVVGAGLFHQMDSAPWPAPARARSPDTSPRITNFTATETRGGKHAAHCFGDDIGVGAACERAGVGPGRPDVGGEGSIRSDPVIAAGNRRQSGDARKG